MDHRPKRKMWNCEVPQDNVEDNLHDLASGDDFFPFAVQE
jgi:hypothetical protein